MPKFSEDTFDDWRKPASDHEEEKLENAKLLVRKALQNNKEMSKHNYELFGQGSYANDTNVRLNSDIDLNVMYTDAFYYMLPEGKTPQDYGISPYTQLSFSAYKDMMEKALVDEFGRSYVKRENKCIRVLGNGGRGECDVVPTFEYRRFSNDGKYVSGVKLVTDAGDLIKGYPKQHTANAIEKNKNTARRFKRLTRIVKRIRYRMKEDNINFPASITSFLIECLIWNVPNKIIIDAKSWTEMIRESIIHIYNQTKDGSKCKEWGEVSELLYLFHSGRKWTVNDVNQFTIDLWNFLEFK
jgi:hypothetical protein